VFEKIEGIVDFRFLRVCIVGKRLLFTIDVKNIRSESLLDQYDALPTIGCRDRM